MIQLLETNGTFPGQDSLQFKMVDLKIMNFSSCVYRHVACCTKNRTNLLFMLGLPRLVQSSNKC